MVITSVEIIDTEMIKHWKNWLIKNKWSFLFQKNNSLRDHTLSDKGIELVSMASAFLNRKHRLQKRSEKATNVLSRSPMDWNLQW